jgi:hypothetical protein
MRLVAPREVAAVSRSEREREVELAEAEELLRGGGCQRR